MTILPLILIIDDLLGRVVAEGTNDERARFCKMHRLVDVSGQSAAEVLGDRMVARAVFVRGQFPVCAQLGDVVENSLQHILETVRSGFGHAGAREQWALVLVDLCFFTGNVTVASNARFAGMARGRQGDDEPDSYFGLEILDALRREFPDLPIVMTSTMPRGPVTRSLSVLGADGFLDKTEQGGDTTIGDQLHKHGLVRDESGLIIGGSKALLKALRSSRRLAAASANVLIRGERGTGKELITKYIHDRSARAKYPLITFDSGALSPELYADTLFGHKRGSFTGADRERRGVISEAHRGDLFLDEVGNMPITVQMGLLRVIEYRKIVPLGATTAEGAEVDVRFLSATNANLEEMCVAGAFRDDLYDRLREGGTLVLPPLRERLDDIHELSKALVLWAESTTTGARERNIDFLALEKLQNYEWPGNIRELRGVILRAVSSHPDLDHLLASHIDLPSTVPFGPRRQITPSQKSTNADLPAVSAFLGSVEFKSMAPEDLAAKLGQLESSWAKFMAEYVKAALNATRRRTPENPSGELLVHPAIKLITGDRTIKASKAYDIVKRLVGPYLQTLASASEEDLLKDVVGRAAAKRMKRRGTGTDQQSEDLDTRDTQDK